MSKIILPDLGDFPPPQFFIRNDIMKHVGMAIEIAWLNLGGFS